MNKAFIFDMDGVLVNSEKAWMKYDKLLIHDIFGDAIAAKLPDTTGLSVGTVYDEAVKLGYSKPKEVYMAVYDSYAKKIYSEALLTPQTDRLIANLQANNFHISVVSSSPQHWVDIVMDRLPYKDAFAAVLCLNDHPTLRAKPYPDGYSAMMKTLGTVPEHVIVLEDSNYGIQAAKSAGAYVIGLKENLHPGYEQTGADVYAESMGDVIGLVEAFDNILFEKK